MAEKGGKEFSKSKGKSIPKSAMIKEGGKTSRKASLKNLKSGGKSSSATPSTNGQRGKEVKAVPFSELELKLEADLPKNANLLMDCEAVSLLEGIEYDLQLLSDDQKMKTPESFPKTLAYAQSIAQRYTDSGEVSKALQKLKDVGASDAEICMISNVGPEIEDEVYALVPCLKDKKRENRGRIREVLAELAKLKQPKNHGIV